MGQFDQFSILSLGGAEEKGEKKKKELSFCSLLRR